MKKTFLFITTAAVFAGYSVLTAQDTTPKDPAAPPPPPPAAEGKDKPDGPPPPHPPGDIWKKLDADGDGKVSKDEFLAHSKAEAENRFDKVDGDSDGAISKEEFEEAGRKMRDAREQERNRGPRDGNKGPGPGDRPEGFRKPEGPGGPGGPGPGGEQGNRGPGGPGGEGGGPDRQRGPGGGGNMMKEMFKRMDSNSDGTVSKDEYMANATERFEQMDADKDGQLTPADVEESSRRFRGGDRGPDGGGPPRDQKPEGGPEKKDGI